MGIKILIVDDSELMRAGIRTKLEMIKSFEIVGEAIDGVDAITKVSEMQPDVVVMDINMPNLSGIEATEKILHINPDIKVIGLSIHSGEHYVKDMLHAGAVAYLLKDDAPDELIRAVYKVDNGEMYLSSAITEVALRKDNPPPEFAGISILKTKLYKPALLDSYVIRKKIIDKLNRNIAMPLSVVIAGAGFGKSVAISQWLENTSYKCTWLTIDDEHNDFRSFLFYLCEAIEKLYPDALTATHDLIIEEDCPPFREIFNTMSNEICDINKQFILVLDDFQIVSEKNVLNFFDEWLRFPPPKVHLSVISRRDPFLKINSLRNNNLLTEIRMDDLSFSNDEIANLFKKILNIELDHQTIALLQEKTGGWVIGLRMASMLLEDKEDLDNIAEILAEELGSSANFMNEMMKAKQETKLDQKRKIDLIILTPRELIVLQCIADGLSNQEIADNLFNSVGTIKKHVSNMFNKMDVPNRVSLVIKGRELGFLEKKE